MPDQPANPISFLTTILTIVPLFGLMAFGALARKFKLLEHKDSIVLSRFAVMVALPALVLSALIKKPLSVSDLALPSLYWLAQLVVLACIYLLKPILKFDKGTTGAAILSTFGNTGFIGYPIASAIFPNKMPETIMIDQLGMSIILYLTIGLIGARYGDTTGHSIRIKDEIVKVAKNPVFVAVVVGILAHAVLQHFPSAIISPVGAVVIASITLLGSATVPVIMTAVGMRLNVGHARQFIPLIMVFGVLKLIVMPVAAWAIGHTIYHFGGEMLGDCVLLCAMPPSASGTAFAAELKIRPELSVATFFVLTISCAVTIPLILTVLHL